MKIPFLELRTQREQLRPAINAAIESVLDADWYVLGEQGRLFEEEMARFLESGGASQTHVVGVGSGTEALHLSLVALGIGPGDEVITTPLTAAATAMAIRAAGATPVFADVDSHLTLDPNAVRARVTDRTRALLPVHLYGHPADLGPLIALCRDHGLSLIEDCAQSHGTLWNNRPVGTIGDVAAFSFYPSKNLGAYGDAGAIACSDGELAERLRKLRNYGEAQRYHHVIEGFNSRLDELQAAILRAKLPHLSAWNTRRRAVAAAYQEQICHPAVSLPTEKPGMFHTYHLFVVRTPHRDALRRHLEARGVGTQIHYPVPLHRQKAFAFLDQPAGACPVAERAADEVLSLPVYPEINDAQIAYVAQCVNAFDAEAA